MTDSTTITALVTTHLLRLEDEGRAAATMDTYRFAAGKLESKLGGVRVSEATAGRIDSAIRAMSKAHGPTMARQAKTILRGALGIAVIAGALDSNPVRDVSPIKSKTPRRVHDHTLPTSCARCSSRSASRTTARRTIWSTRSRS
ncbi:hypothetical protein [Rhodococcus tukisamuensis]|uniref:Core-binding (CB) domain-containing protein n=1 Tax=Rhodococcus tukisamuensis TaxID=168276 RepID=A0A1G6X2C9_9NOCA|nr:hypothetical protein [Rhodococcus tukisamuensis]SDD72194.1 hypothetical protein SAMN05444580_10662 [Rhodococcus tukisamuensis]